MGEIASYSYTAEQRAEQEWPKRGVRFVLKMSYDPSQWYSYSKNRPNEVPPTKKAVFIQQKSPEKNESNKQGDSGFGPATTTTTGNDASLSKVSTVIESKIDVNVVSETKSEPEHNRKLNNFVKRLQKMVRELPR